jgi:hypothetical protein
MGAVAIAGLLLLAGCQPQRKIVAEVNNESITDEDFYSHVETVTEIPAELNTDAGGLTMLNMIRDRLTEQLARKYNAVPSDETVSSVMQYEQRMIPNTRAALAAGKVTLEDLKRQSRFQLEQFGIGTNGDKPNDLDMAKAYDEYKGKPAFLQKSAYTIKILRVPDDATGKRVIADLKQTGDFKGAAQKVLNAPPAVAASAGKEQVLDADQVPPDLKQELDKLKPNEITPEPVAVKIPNPQQPMVTQTMYFVAQLKGKEGERVLTKDEVRFLLARIVLEKTHPDWQVHYQKELADFTRKSQIRVALQRYENIVDTYVRPLAEAEASGHPTTGMPTSQPGTLQ